MTSQPEPRDVSVNEPSKEYLRKENRVWSLSENLPLAPCGKIKRASASKVAEWGSVALKQIARNIAEESFKKWCI
jgi:hypothetical protein